LAHARLERVAVLHAELLLEVAVALEVLRVVIALQRRRQSVHLVLQRDDLRERRHERVQDRARAAELLGLMEGSDRDAAPARDLSGLGLERARHEAQQRRLAGAVRADQPDVLARVHLPRQPREQVLPRVSERDVGELDEHLRLLAHVLCYDLGPMEAFKVLIADDLSPRGTAILQACPGIVVDVKVGLKPAELVAIIGGYHGLVVRSATKVTAEILEAARQLKIVGRAGIGVDNIDVRAASRRGIIVENTPSGNATTAAEHALCLLLSMARYIPQATA